MPNEQSVPTQVFHGEMRHGGHLYFGYRNISSYCINGDGIKLAIAKDPACPKVPGDGIARRAWRDSNARNRGRRTVRVKIYNTTDNPHDVLVVEVDDPTNSDQIRRAVADAKVRGEVARFERSPTGAGAFPEVRSCAA